MYVRIKLRRQKEFRCRSGDIRLSAITRLVYYAESVSNYVGSVSAFQIDRPEIGRRFACRSSADDPRLSVSPLSWISRKLRIFYAITGIALPSRFDFFERMLELIARIKNAI